MSLQERIKSLNTDRMDLDDKVELLAQVTVTEQAYEGVSVPAPDWLVAGKDTLTEEITRSRKDAIKKMISDKKAKLDSLKTADQKRADLRKELAALEKALGG